MQKSLTQDSYDSLYQKSIKEPEAFWAEQAKQFLEWIQPWGKVLNKHSNRTHASWFEGGTLNVAYN